MTIQLQSAPPVGEGGVLLIDEAMEIATRSATLLRSLSGIPSRFRVVIRGNEPHELSRQPAARLAPQGTSSSCYPSYVEFDWTAMRNSLTPQFNFFSKKEGIAMAQHEA